MLTGGIQQENKNITSCELKLKAENKLHVELWKLKTDEE